jgi:7-carboxy-7-deazaguanine synthase
VETSGVRSIADLPRPCKVVLDLKTPGSGVTSEWDAGNLLHLRGGDELKAVVTGREDFEWLIGWFDEHRARLPADVVISAAPAAPALSGATLAAWILESRRDLRLNLQLHKILWPEIERGR